MTNALLENMVSKDQLLSYIYGLTIKTGKGLEKAVELAQEQIPDVIHQFLMWKLAENILSVIIPLILFGSMFIIKNKLWPKNFDENKPDHFISAIGVFLGFVATGAISLINLCTNGYTVIQIWLAPKVYLLEQVKNLLQ